MGPTWEILKTVYDEADGVPEEQVLRAAVGLSGRSAKAVTAARAEIERLIAEGFIVRVAGSEPSRIRCTTTAERATLPSPIALRSRQQQQPALGPEAAAAIRRASYTLFDDLCFRQGCTAAEAAEIIRATAVEAITGMEPRFLAVLSPADAEGES